jgi:hypothetical protein
MMRKLWSTALLLVLAATPAAASGEFVETFDSGDEGGWTFGTPGSIPPAGGNPGPYLDSGVLDTFAPRLRTTVSGSLFTGDYRAQGVTSVGVDLNTFSAQTTGGRPLALMLIKDPGTPGDPFDDTAAYFLGPNIPDVGDGWLSFDYLVPSEDTELPAGWLLLNLGDSGAPANHTWDEVIQDVDVLQFHYGDPTFVFIFQQWTLGADNVRITSSGAGGCVRATITGQVGFNGIGEPPLGDVGGGESVVMTFLVDSENFQDGVPGDTRGYEIDQSSFELTFDGSLTVGLQDPFPGGQTPFFTLVEGFPVSDGFFVSTSPFSPGGVPLEQTPFNANLSLGYEGDTLGSLDILDALGTYDFDGLTSFGFNIWSIAPDNVAMDMDFEQMTLEEAECGGGPEPPDPPVPATSPFGLIVLALIVLLLGTAAVRYRSRIA